MNRPNLLIAVSRLPQRLRWAWSWLLIALTWQGPVPLIHCHGAEVNLASPDHEWLASHLCHYHLAALLTGNHVRGWHLHLAYPEAPDGDADHSSQDSTRPSTKRVLMETSDPGFSRVISDAARACCGPLAVNQLAEVTAAIAPTAAIGHMQIRGTFFTTFAAALALPLRFGILRV